MTPEEKLAREVVRQWARDLRIAIRHQQWENVTELGEWLNTEMAQFWCDAAEISLKQLKIVYRELTAKLPKKPDNIKRAIITEKPKTIERAVLEEKPRMGERAVTGKNPKTLKRARWQKKWKKILEIINGQDR